MKKALIVVDMQNDFVEGGALAVNGGVRLSRDIYAYIGKWAHLYEAIVFTQDWHNPPPDDNDGHFNKWPVHCVANTPGAVLVPWVKQAYMTLQYNEMVEPRDRNIFKKGQGADGYSGFLGDNNNDESLAQFLDRYEVTALDIVGIAGDYCVLQTAIDGQEYGYQVNILPELVKSVGGDIATAQAIRSL